MPVDVIRTEDFTSQGSTDLANQLRTVVPSFSVSIQPISDAATIVRPAASNVATQPSRQQSGLLFHFPQQ